MLATDKVVSSQEGINYTDRRKKACRQL